MKQTILSVILSFFSGSYDSRRSGNSQGRDCPIGKTGHGLPGKWLLRRGKCHRHPGFSDETPLTKEGTTSFDKHIRVEDSYDFGDASVLGATKKSRQFFSDKTFTVSQVTSDEYSTEELMDRLEDNAYVVNVEPDYHMYKMGSTNDTLSDAQWDLDGGDFSPAVPRASNIPRPHRPRLQTPRW